MPAALAIIIAAYFLSHLYAFMGSLYFCFMCIISIPQGRWIRSAVYGCLAFGLIYWWYVQEDVFPGPYEVESWVKGSFWVILGAVGIVVYIKLCKWGNERRNARLQVQAFSTGEPVQITGNVVPFVHATRQEKERVMTIQKHLCANPYCNADLRDGVPHWDHITPRSKGGTDSVHNGQWLCDTCNMNKGDLDWLEFIFRYATGMGMDPNKNQKPWQKWVLNRTQNGLQCQG